MDYEKAYKQALERAKAEAIDGYLDAVALETIFPELRESEDEQALRIIKKRMCYDPVPISDEDRRIVENWLEKQKYDRMKPIYDARESFESALEKAWNDYHNGYENVDKLEDDYVECAHAKGFREGYLFGIEKQKEQKPVEWSEEDEKELDCIINVLDRLGFEEFRKSSRDQDNEEERFYYKEIQFLKQLKSLRPSWKPSEEDKQCLDEAIDLLVNLGYDGEADNLKHLKKQI